MQVKIDPKLNFWGVYKSKRKTIYTGFNAFECHNWSNLTQCASMVSVLKSSLLSFLPYLMLVYGLTTLLNFPLSTTSMVYSSTMTRIKQLIKDELMNEWWHCISNQIYTQTVCSFSTTCFTSYWTMSDCFNMLLALSLSMGCWVKCISTLLEDFPGGRRCHWTS